jgi:hypothetical protein
MTLAEYIKTLQFPVVTYVNVFSNVVETPVWHDFEFPFDLDDAEGEIKDGDWEWDGESDLRDYASNTITGIRVRDDEGEFTQQIIDYALFSDGYCTSISEIDEAFIKQQADYCQVSQRRIAEALNGWFNFDSELAEAQELEDEDTIEEIQTAKKAVEKFLAE